MSTEPTESAAAIENHGHPYYRVMVVLTVFTIGEIAWIFLPLGRAGLLLGLGAMAAVKASRVALFYMHLRYESRLIWMVIAFPLLLIAVMVIGFLPDAFHYWG